MEGDERHGRGDGGAAKPPSRTKSSVRRAREFKEFDEIEVLDIGAGDAFDLIDGNERAAATVKVRPTTHAAPSLVASSRSNSGGEAPARTPSFAKRQSEPVSSRTSTDIAPPRLLGRVPSTRRGDTGTHASFSSSSPAILGSAGSAPTVVASRSARSLPHHRASVGPERRPAAKAAPASATSSVDSDAASTAAALQLQELKDEAEQTKQLLRTVEQEREAAAERHGADKEQWAQEREGLLSGMRSGGREVDRVVAESQTLQKAMESLTASLSEVESARAVQAARIKELEGQLAEAVGRGNRQVSSRLGVEEQLSSTKRLLEKEAQRADAAAQRVKCLTLSHQELAQAAERDRLQSRADKDELQSSVTRLTSLVESLTHNMKREKGVSQNALRSLESLEARNKRVEAEKVRLEQLAQGEGLPHSSSFDSPVLATPLAGDGAEELWAAITELEASKRDIEAAREEDTRKLKQNVETAQADKEALWQECERLSKQVETLQGELAGKEQEQQGEVSHQRLEAKLAESQARLRAHEASAADTHALWQECDALTQQVHTLQGQLEETRKQSTSRHQELQAQAASATKAKDAALQAELAAKEAQAEQAAELWQECEKLSGKVEELEKQLAEERQANERRQAHLTGSPHTESPTAEHSSMDQSNESIERQQRCNSGRSSPMRDPAPLKSNSLNGEPTHFGFIPFKLRDKCDTDKSLSRRKSLQQARMARKVEGSTCVRDKRAFDSLLDDLDAMKRSSSTLPSTPVSAQTPRR